MTDGAKTLEHVELGRTGERISRMGMGAMPLSLEGRPSREDAKAVIRRAVELGVDFIDTADAYCIDDDDFNHNEALISEALGEIGESDRVVVATKAGTVRPDGRWERNGDPDHIRRACERSLEALGVERIDLYQLHSPDPEHPLEESVGAFARLREEGKVGAVGLSNVTLDQLRRAERVVEIHSVQNRFNPWDPSAEESGLIEHCHRNGITFIPYSPLGGGRRVKLLPRSEALRRVAERVGCTPEELVLAWVLTRSPSLVPIPGASRTSSVESSVRALDLELDDGDLREAEEAFEALPE